MRVVNPYKVRLVTSGTTIEDKQIVIPVGETFDGIGQNQQVEDYVEKLADESVNPIVDYEKWRYTPLSGENSNVTTDLGYEFYFYGSPSYEDYNLPKAKSDGNTQNFDSSTFGQVIYSNPQTFTFSNVEVDILFTLKDLQLNWQNPPSNITQSAVDSVLSTNKFGFDIEINNQPINIITNPYTFNDVITPLSQSTYVPSPPGWAVPSSYNRLFSGTLVLNIKNLSPSDTIKVICKITSQPNNGTINGSILGYDVSYKGLSYANEGYYTQYTTPKIPYLNIENNFKSYTNSFFRLDYYDSVIEESQNLLFTDVLTVSEGKQFKAEFSTKLNKQNYFLYWLKNDPVIEEQGYRDVYMSARFFNASTGLIHQFFNTDEKIPTIDLYETKYRYTKVRLYKDYTYVIEDRTIIEANLLGNISWTVTETLSPGTTQLKLYEIRTK